MLDAAQCDTVEERPPCVEPGAADKQRHADAAKISPIDFLKEMLAHSSGPVYVCSLDNLYRRARRRLKANEYPARALLRAGHSIKPTLSVQQL
jgi:hypothetical protein